MREGHANRLWLVWLTVGALMCTLYPLVPAETLPSSIFFTTVSLAAVTVTITGVRRHRPANTRSWYVFVAGQVAWTCGDLTYAFTREVLHESNFPSWADAFYLSAYPLMALGLLLLLRGRRDLTGLLDAGIVAAGLGLVYWVFVISPIVADTSVPVFSRFVSVAYPAGDVLMLVVVARLLTRPEERTPTVRLLAAGMGLVLTADVFYSILSVQSAFTGGLVGAGFLFAYVCWGAAAQHPSLGVSTQAAPRVLATAYGRGRLTLLAACTLIAPAVLFVEGAGHRGQENWIAIGVGAVVLFLLMLARMSGFVAQVRAQAGQLEELAMRDELTGLANRRRFEQRLREAMPAGSPQVVLLDLTGFKKVNDRFGHAIGDQLLAAVGERLRSRLRDTDLVARMGGDEFAVLLQHATEAEGDVIVTRLTTAMAEPIVAGGQVLLIGANFGVADTAGTADPGEAMRRADVAMYAAKDRGERNRRYTAELDDQIIEADRLGAEMRNALDTGQFRLVYQPIVSLPDARIVAVEALVRWDHPTRGPVSPADFIPVAEQNGLIIELGAWILHTACAQAVEWRDNLGARAPGRMSVNVSARQLAEPGFADAVSGVLARTGLSAPGLIVEVTETAVFGGGQAVQTVQDLHEIGVRIALDDFGTGHSSLGLLQSIPVDVLKVDKTFVDNIATAGRDAVIATALIHVANGLGLTAVAEGVETEEQADELHRLGYSLAQGYYFGRPVPEPDFALRGPRVASLS